MTDNAPLSADIDLIQRIIPHRYPFLLIDKVRDIVPNETAVGIKNVTFNEPHFQGHFPGAPIMPGVTIIEALAQTAAVMVGVSEGLADKNMLVYFMAIDKAKFRRKVVPGDVLELEVTVKRGGGKVWKFEGVATVEGEMAAQAEFTAMMDLGAAKAEVRIAQNTEIKSHAVITGRISIGPDCVIFPFAVIGEIPQDLKFRGEQTRLEIGARNRIREHVTVNTGTEGGGGLTRIGDDCLIMAGAHVAHDAQIGNRVILVNNSAVAGHCQIEDEVIIGGLSGIHQWVRIGRGAIIGAVSMVTNDVIPYGLVQGPRGQLHGLNLVGLKRKGVPRVDITALRAAYQMLAQGEGAFMDRTKRLGAETESDHVREIVDFVTGATDRSFLIPQ